jgi:hypothetical protein
MTHRRGPARGRRTRRAVLLPGVVLALILLILALNQAARSALHDRMTHLAAARASALAQISHDFDANLAMAVQTAALPGLASLTSGQIAPANALGGVVPSSATSPLPVLPANWTVTPYVAVLDNGGVSAPFGILYVRVPATDPAILPAIEAQMHALQGPAPAAETFAAGDLVASAIGHALDPASEFAVYTTLYADLDGNAVLRAARPGWSNTLAVPVDMGNHALSAQSLTADSVTAQSLHVDGSANPGTLSIGGRLTAGALGVASAGSTANLTAQSSLQAGALTAGSLSAGTAQITVLSAGAATAQALSTPSLDLTGTLTVPGTTTVTTAGTVSTTVHGDQGTPGTVTAGSLTASWAGATAATINLLTVFTCTGCKP